MISVVKRQHKRSDATSSKSPVEDEEGIMRLGHRSGSALRVSFSALILLLG